MKDYDVYLFDWDGTLADTSTIWVLAAQEYLASRGLTPSLQEIAYRMGAWPNFLTLGLKEDDLDDFSTTVRKTVRHKLQDTPLHGGSMELLKELKKRGKKLGIVTAMHSDNVERVREEHRLDDFFDVIVHGDDVTHQKPHPEGVLQALEKLSVGEKPRAIMIGDADRDILAAQNAGIDSMLFFPDSHAALYDLRELQRVNPTYTITSWQQFLDELDKS